MKKLLQLFIVFFAVSTLSQIGNSQAQRVPLYEHFTQASCPPCATFNPAFNDLIINQFDGQAITIKYQSSFPGFDPMYSQNSSQVQDRQSFYSLSGVPSIYQDGIAHNGSTHPSTYNAATVQARINVPSPISVDVNHTLDMENNQVTVSIDIENVSGSDVTGVNLYIAMAEKTIRFSSAPGTNGEKIFHYVMRRMFEGSLGTPIEIPANETLSYEQTYDIPSYIYNVNEMAIIAHVQNNSNRQILNAGLSDAIIAVELPNVYLKDSYALNAGSHCFPDLGEVLTIENTSHIDVTSLEITFTNESSDEFILTQDVDIPANSTVEITVLPEDIDLEGRAIAATVTKVNGAPDVAQEDNIGSRTTWHTFRPRGRDNTSLNFESSTTTAVRSDIFPPSNAGNFYSADETTVGFDPDTRNIGGYAESKTTLLAFFPGWDPTTYAPTSYFIDNIIELDAQSKITFQFDHAYAEKAGISDELAFYYSTDCGATWNEIVSLGKGELVTNTATHNNFFIPAKADWNTTTSEFTVDAEKVYFKVEFIPKGGDALYIDNIEITSEEASSVSEPYSGDISISPNPATSSDAQLNIDINESIQTNIGIYDLSGKLIQSVLQDKLLSAGNHSFSMNGLSSGMYLVKITSAQGATTKKLVIE